MVAGNIRGWDSWVSGTHLKTKDGSEGLALGSVEKTGSGFLTQFFRREEKEP